MSQRFRTNGEERYGGAGVSDPESTTDPRTDPGWTSVGRSEDFGVTVEVDHIDGIAVVDDGLPALIRWHDAHHQGLSRKRHRNQAHRLRRGHTDR